MSILDKVLTYAKMRGIGIITMQAAKAELKAMRSALTICVMFLTSANTITTEKQAELIRALKDAEMPDLADAIAVGGCAAIVGGEE